MRKPGVVSLQGRFSTSDGYCEDWQVRYSKKARYARINVSVQKGIEVVIPAGMQLDPETFLEQHRGFIEQTLAKMMQRRQAFLASLEAPLPTELEFFSAGECWRLMYRETTGKDAAIRKGVSYRVREANAEGGILVLSGAIEDVEECHKTLKRFVMARAKEYLPHLLEIVATELKASYRGCRVRNAHTRLGSCSADGIIMLAARLMFYPPELTFHVICHELSHLKHMDHSNAFHRQLQAYDHEAELHAKQLKTASDKIPPWMG